MTFLYNLFYVKLGSTLLTLLWFPAGAFFGSDIGQIAITINLLV